MITTDQTPSSSAPETAVREAGQTAYEAYDQATGQYYCWDELSPTIQVAWVRVEAACAATRKGELPGRVIDVLTAKLERLRTEADLERRRAEGLDAKVRHYEEKARASGAVAGSEGLEALRAVAFMRAAYELAGKRPSAVGEEPAWNVDLFEVERRAALSQPAPAIPDAVLAERGRALLDVAAERRRQIEAEGWTPKHDDEHDRGQMATAAAGYAYVAGLSQQDRARFVGPAAFPPPLWPWDLRWWKPTDRRRDLVKAGALIVAEIERLDRAAIRNPAPSRTDR